MLITNSSANQLLTEVRRDIDTMLIAYFAQQISGASDMSLQYGRLWKTIDQLSQSGGKRLRPYMVVLAYQCFGGTNRDSIMPVAAAWELLHLSMLIHDDIIDNDLVRYGVKNVAGTYMDIYQDTASDTSRQEHQALSVAVLAGDLILSSAHDIVIHSELGDTDKLQSLAQLTEATFEVVGGELLDTEAALYSMMEADPLLIAKMKTASYSFVGPLQSGAKLAGASDEEIAGIRKLGTVLGCAFQLLDDLAGVFGDPKVSGKSVMSDLSEGKRTYMMQQTYLLSMEPASLVLDELVGKTDLTEEEANRIRTIIIHSGARKKTEELVAKYTTQAYQIINGLHVPDDCREELNSLVSATTKRNY